MPAPEKDTAKEIALLAAIAAGDRDAFRELYARYSPALFSLALRLLNDYATAEEALQDAFVKIWRHAATYDGRKSRPFTWAVTILRRTCFDRIRRQRHAPAMVTLPDDEAATLEFTAGENTRHAAEAHETTGLLRTALATVVAPRRTALELALFSHLTHAEIAARLAQPVGTVKTWIRRGLLDLRATLNPPPP